jgi:RimJ/RimL family protein N-acetyltransferase
VARNQSVTETIEAQRLQLVPLTLADAAALVNGHQPETVRWAEGYPTDGTLVAAGFVVTAEAEGRALGPWGTYQIVRSSDGVVIGDCGFLGPPDHHGWVHVGYGVVEGERHQGYATEALTALIAWAKDRPEATRVLADTACTNLASIRVMEGAGMRRAGSDGDLVYFEA